MQPRWWLVPLTVFVWGGVLLGVAFAYGMVFVNVPYPDPTPAQAAKEAYHSRVCEGIVLAGLLTAAAGAAGLLPFVAAAMRRTSSSKQG